MQVLFMNDEMPVPGFVLSTLCSLLGFVCLLGLYGASTAEVILRP